jgi:predicted transcriptional regulator
MPKRRLSAHKYPNGKEAHAWILQQCGMTHNDIAKTLECSKSYVDVAISNCRKKLTKLGIRVEKSKVELSKEGITESIVTPKVTKLTKFDTLKQLAIEAGLV